MMLNISLDWDLLEAIFQDIAIELLILKDQRNSIQNGETTLSIQQCRNNQIILEQRARLIGKLLRSNARSEGTMFTGGARVFSACSFKDTTLRSVEQIDVFHVPYSDNPHQSNPKREKELLLDADVCHEVFQKQYNDPDVSKFDNVALFIWVNQKVE